MRIGPHDLLELGATLLPHVQALISDPRSKPGDLLNHIQLLALREPIVAKVWHRIEEWPPGSPLVLWSAYWCASGFPQVRLTHKLAASLMCTSISPEALDDLRLPWSSFLIQVPTGLVEVSNPLGGTIEIAALAVQATDAGFRVVAVNRTEPPLLLPLRASSFEGLAEPELDADDLDLDFIEFHPLDDRDRRAVALLGRLFVGVSAELGGREQGERPQSPPRIPASWKRAAPKASTIMLNRDVAVDCRPAISLYLGGHRGTQPTVQVLVRGHWKRQPYGPEQSLRKLIHIEPYWRGPEGAPVSLRSTGP